MTVEDLDDRAVVRLSGELDIATGSQLGPVLGAAATRRPVVVVALEDVWFMDASGLARLVRARDLIARRGGLMALTRGPASVMRIVTVSGTESSFVFLDTATSPLASSLAA